MKTLFWGIALAIALIFNGCATLDYAKERKATICAEISEGKCPTGFEELDAGKLPYVGDTASIVTDRVLTCVTYTKEDVACPDGSKKIVVDLIK